MKVGDRVVCIDGNRWFEENGDCVNGPYQNEELIIFGIMLDGGLLFDQYDLYDGFNPINFRKLNDNFTNALTKKLAEDFIEQDDKVRELEKELTEEDYINHQIEEGKIK